MATTELHTITSDPAAVAIARDFAASELRTDISKRFGELHGDWKNRIVSDMATRFLKAAEEIRALPAVSIVPESKHLSIPPIKEAIGTPPFDLVSILFVLFFLLGLFAYAKVTVNIQSLEFHVRLLEDDVRRLKK